jgi:quinol-cytochrome oxidoreductase complex cytochrome b subunit
MGDTQQPQPAGTGATGPEAAAELAEIRRRQEQVIKAALVPAWYWWAFAAPIVAIGAARDSGNLVVQAVTIPLAALVMIVLIGATIPELRRRVKVRSAPQNVSRAAAAIFGMILLVDTVILSTAASLHAAHSRYPGTIGCAAGAAVLVIAGTLLNRYSRRLMLSQVRQQIGGPPQSGGSTP